jgi:acyl dehydratase
MQDDTEVNYMSAPTTTGAKLETRTIRTINAARESKGSIHDDEKAREMGYAGGFVGGVTVLGYMMRLMHENFGRAWLATGTFNGRLRQPTYADVDVTVEGTVVEEPSATNAGRVTVELRVLDQNGTVTAFASASCKVETDG